MNAYDFDKTIYDGDSTADFYLFCLGRHKKIIACLPSLLVAVIKYYVFKKGTKTDMKQVMYRFLRKADPKNDIPSFWHSHMKKIKPWYLSQRKDDDLVISASPEFLLKPACDELGIKNLIASQVNPLTGIYTGLNCHGEEKVRRLHEQFDEPIDCFYSDSHSDDPMAEIAEKAFLVKGDEISDWD